MALLFQLNCFFFFEGINVILYRVDIIAVGTSLFLAELQIRGVIADYSKRTFVISQQNHML